MGMERDGRTVGVNLEKRLVIKIFSDQDGFSQEHSAYRLLSANRCPCIPDFYGSFHNELVGLSAIIISYESPWVEGSMSSDDRQGFLRHCLFSLNLNGGGFQGPAKGCSNQPACLECPPPRSQVRKLSPGA